MKLVKDRGILSFTGIQDSNSQESTVLSVYCRVLYCGVQRMALVWSGPHKIIYIISLCLVMHNISR